MDAIHSPDSKQTSDSKQTAQIPPLAYNILSLSSYVLTHASSSASPRTLAYANLALNTLLVMSENTHIMSVFCKPASSKEAIRICRQVIAFFLMTNFFLTTEAIVETSAPAGTIAYSCTGLCASGLLCIVAAP
jgi:hypothetical protein